MMGKTDEKVHMVQTSTYKINRSWDDNVQHDFYS